MVKNSEEFFAPRDRRAGEWTSISHYYGDIVRFLFLIIAILLGFSVPLSENIPLGLLISAPAMITLVVLAGYMNPRGKIVFTLSAIVAALGALTIEVFAVAAFVAENVPLATSLGAAWLLSVIALYFSVKNLRASRMHMIGREDGAGENTQ